MANKTNLRIVLDTNALLRCISRRSAYKSVIDQLFSKRFELYISSDILLEYEEKLTEFFSAETAELFLGALTLLDNVKKTEVYFFLQLIIIDPDDNKFVDCAFAGNVHYLVTDDRHYNILQERSFPKINILKLDAFKDLLENIM